MSLTLTLPGIGDIAIESIDFMAPRSVPAAFSEVSIVRKSDKDSGALFRDNFNGRVYDEVVVTFYGTDSEKVAHRRRLKMASFISVGVKDKIENWVMTCIHVIPEDAGQKNKLGVPDRKPFEPFSWR